MDILVHPGLISHEDASIAAENDIYLEITSRNGHNRTNGHLVKVARDTGCRMLVQSDAHEPRDLLDSTAKWLVARGAGLTEEEAERVLAPDPDLIRRFSRL